MPPKKKSSSKPSTSRDLIRTGSKHVFSDATRRPKRQAQVKASTTRALILRNGKHGAQGTGEIAIISKLTGREKLDLIAEDIMVKAKTAIMRPFSMDTCIQIAQAQFSEYLDDISNLKDPQLFSSLIEQEMQARRSPDSADLLSSLLNDSTHVASTVANRIHNSYLLASAWKLAGDSLLELQEAGIKDSRIASQLKHDDSLRALYLSLYSIADILVSLSQSKFAVLATTTPHYSKYFKKDESVDSDYPPVVFDRNQLRSAGTSFLDSIILELCFPRDTYPKDVLYQILRDAVDEAPNEAKRFPQALWDAVGDLSETVQFMQILEAPLTSPDLRGWETEPVKMSEAYTAWIEAQKFSLAASDKFATYKKNITPLSKTRDKKVLETMWKLVNANYKSVSGLDVASLWLMRDTMKPPVPSWHPIYIPKMTDDINTQNRTLTGPTKPLMVTAGDDSDSDGMPGLQDISDSDTDSFSDSDSEDEDYGADNKGNETDDSGYDTDQEYEVREKVREAYDTVHGWFDPDEDMPPYLDEKKDNPFLKLLGSLTERLFKSDPKLSTLLGTGPPHKKSDAKKTTTQPTGVGNTIIEEVSDEDGDGDSAQKKKKKKKPKKKKKAATVESVAAVEERPATPEPVPHPKLIQTPPVTPAKKKAPVPTPESAKPKVQTAPVPAYASSISLVSDDTVQSARTYLKSENLDIQKVKTKTRAERVTFFSKSSRMLSKMGFGKDKSEVVEEKPAVRRGWFADLPKRAKGHMHQLLNTAEDETRGGASMKWDAFVQLMQSMGFDYDPSTAGSSVRFTPRNSEDGSITFHKPHPDSTIPPITLKNFSKRLQRRYGWKPEDLAA